jgi:hypothetical protein
MKPSEAMYVVPLIVVAAAFLVLLVEHILNVKHARFQGVYLRSVFIFPLVSVLAFVGGQNYHVLPWIEVLIGMIEGYIFMLFFGLFVGWAWHKGDVYANMFGSARTRVACYTAVCSCGPRYSSGKAALLSIQWQMYQFAVVKPLVNVAKAVSEISTGEVTKPVQFVTAVFNFVSIVVALKAVLGLYQALTKGPGVGHDGKVVDSKINHNLLQGLSAASKFIVIKTFLFFIVLNGLVVVPLIESDTLKAPPPLCDVLDSAAPDYKLACHSRFEAWIIMLESALIMLLGVFCFRHHSIDALEEQHKTSACKTSACSLFISIFKFWDVVTVLPRPPKNESLVGERSLGSLPDSSMDEESKKAASKV